MSLITFSDTSDWELVNEDQDVRGFDVLDDAGNRVGTVEKMILDTDAELITMLVLDDDREISARDVTIGDGVVYLGGAGAMASGAEGDVRSGVTVFDDGGRVVRRESVAEGDVSAYTEDFRTHHASSYGAAGRQFDDDMAAYHYGFTQAHADTNRNRSYTDAEADLRSGYTAGRDFDADVDAVRYGFGRAQRQSR